jgi:uroporphyrinogen-III synthase
MRVAELPSLWLLTRESADSKPLLQWCAANTIAASNIPCIVRVKKPWRVPAISSDADGWLFLTSPFVAAGMRWSQLSRWRCAALEPRTVDVVRLRHAVDVSVSGGAVALAKALNKQLGPKRPGVRPPVIVYPTSQLGKLEDSQRMAKKLLSQRATVLSPLAYETRAPPGLTRRLKKHCGQKLNVVFLSPSAVRFFRQATRGLGRGLTLSQVCCIGESTVRAYARFKMARWPQGLALRDIEQLKHQMKKGSL